MILQLFATSLALYLLFRLHRWYRKRLDMDFLSAMTLIADSLDSGDSIETAIDRIAKGKDIASWWSRKLLAEARASGIKEAFRKFERPIGSQVFSVLSALVAAYDESGKNISPQLKSVAESLAELRAAEDTLDRKTRNPVRVLQFVGVVGMPVLAVFISLMLDLPLSSHASYFFGFIAVLYGSFDLIIYRDSMHTIFILPLFITSHMFALTIIGPYVGGLFL